MATKHIGIFAATTLIIGIAGWSIRSRLANKDTLPASVPPPTATTTEEQGKLRVEVPDIHYGFEAAKGGEAPTTVLSKGLSLPDLDQPVVIPRFFLPDVAARAVGEIQKLSAALRENPTNAALWGELGLKRKGIEDYNGARLAYEYSLALAPYNAVTADNLGVLYGYYLQEPKKAEENFLKALDIEPEMVFRYLRLYELYKDIFQDVVKAKAILEQGLQKHPGNPSFKALLEPL